MKILIIDDDPDDTLLFQEAVFELDPNASCIVAHTCENLEQSMNVIGTVDVIFIDAHMFPIDGKACLVQLINLVDRTRTKIIMYSGSLSPAEQIELETAGADYVLIKASSYEMLRVNIAKIMTDTMNPTC